MKIAIVTNTFGKYHRQNVAVESWLHLKDTFPDDVSLFNLQFEDEKGTFTDHYPGVTTAHVLKQSSQTVIIEPVKKKLPLIFEIITEGFEVSGADYVVYTNSDVMLLPRLVEYIIAEKPDCMAGPRLDIESIDSFQKVLDNEVKPVRVEIAGYDFFVFERKWFEQHKKHFESDFVIGKPLFDVDYAGLMVLLGKKYHIANGYPLMALHIHHGIESVTTDSPEKDHNESEHERNPLFRVANNVMFFNLQNNLCRRKPWAVFIQPAENEQSNQKKFFDTMNIHHKNEIKYVE